ncbi:LysR family transcriptional regulator [Arenibaculum pallidiluteum]|uniref:LysR family transcriptional regulator n=1 Tax=Arenibaculum pallidiluteum TaxID=2812559 RepID=UPI001A95FEF7|nr:LysR family transcriptional regulator [Arenibaculum pallidiluteum]
MISLVDYRTFVAIVDEGHLTAAARRLGRSVQAVSRSLALLEKDLGVTLIRRTTRRLQPTAAGLAFHARICAALADIESARQEAASTEGEIAGSLRVGASTLFAPAFITPIAAAFMNRYPAVRIELDLADDYVDLIAASLDLAVRIGDLPDSRLVARKLGDLRRVVFAAPGYLARHGRPEEPSDLKRHDCVVRTAAQAPCSWRFRVGGDTLAVEIDGRFRSSGAAVCNEAVALGLGIGYAPLWQVRPLLDAGRVELLLSDYEAEPTPVHVVWPAVPVLPARTRAFADILAARLAVERI